MPETQAKSVKASESSSEIKQEVLAANPNFDWTVTKGVDTATFAIRLRKELKEFLDVAIKEGAKRSQVKPTQYFAALCEILFINQAHPPSLKELAALFEATNVEEVRQVLKAEIKKRTEPYLERFLEFEMLLETGQFKPKVLQAKSQQIRPETEQEKHWKKIEADAFEPFTAMLTAQTQDINLGENERFFCSIDFPYFNSQAIRVSLTEGWIEAHEIAFTRSLLFNPKKSDRPFDSVSVQKIRAVAVSHDNFENYQYDRDFVARWEKSGFDVNELRGIVLGDGETDLNQNSDTLYAWDLVSELTEIPEEVQEKIDTKELPVFVNIGKQSLYQNQVLSYEAECQTHCEFDYSTDEWTGEACTVLNLKVMALYRVFWLCMSGVDKPNKITLKKFTDDSDRALLAAAGKGKFGKSI